jgi:hypothetical protein
MRMSNLFCKILHFEPRTRRRLDQREEVSAIDFALPARRVPEVLDSRTLSESGVRCVFASLSAGLARVANQYAWCSAAWFESNAQSGFVKSVYSFKPDLIKVRDDF